MVTSEQIAIAAGGNVLRNDGWRMTTTSTEMWLQNSNQWQNGIDLPKV